MEFFDMHTHGQAGESSQKLVNIRYQETFVPVGGRWYSVGVHPWDVADAAGIDWERFHSYVVHPQVLAIGECGLDKCVHGEMWGEQTRLFLRQAQMADELGKPLIVHNVRATDVLLSLRKKGRYTAPWVLHGFRGKPEAALQAVSQGLYLSFGIRYNEEALRRVPVERILLETDDSGAVDIRAVYEQAALVRSVSVEELAVHIRHNVHRLLGI